MGLISGRRSFTHDTVRKSLIILFFLVFVIVVRAGLLLWAILLGGRSRAGWEQKGGRTEARTEAHDLERPGDLAEHVAIADYLLARLGDELAQAGREPLQVSLRSDETTAER